MTLIRELISKYANSGWTKLLENLMSETSQVYFNVVNDEVQDAAAKLIAQVFHEILAA
jgi:hypothetical protein